MKKLFYFVVVLLVSNAAIAQKGYVFEDVIRLPTTSVKDQYASGTCWSFSGISFLESEMARVGVDLKNVPDISEMYVVRKCYEGKAEKYVRMHGLLNFGAGGSFYDVLWSMKEFGMVPEDVYRGLNYGKDKHNHSELDAVLKSYVEALKDNKGLTTAWLEGFKGILDAYLGKEPTSFEYKGKNYTPKSFVKDVMKLNPDDYVSITSYTHHPFFAPFALEIQDNWQWSVSYNVPIKDMVRIADNALKNDFSIAWGADVSEVYFSHRDGVAVVPDLEMKELARTERSRWESVDKDKYNLSEPGKEKTITQEMRQTAYNNFQTTDDHGLHIVGLAKDQNGTEYYIVKNSWNTDNPYDGYVYVSKAFFIVFPPQEGNVLT